MKSETSGHFVPASSSHEASCGTALLGRLGQELAHVYGDVVEAPLPPQLKQLLERLEAVLQSSED